MTEPTLPTQGMSRAKDILPLLPFAKSTLWRKVKSGSSPSPSDLVQIALLGETKISTLGLLIQLHGSKTNDPKPTNPRLFDGRQYDYTT